MRVRRNLAKLLLCGLLAGMLAIPVEAKTVTGPGFYWNLARYNALVERYEAAKGKLKALQKKRTERLQKADAIGGFMFALMERDAPLETFTDGLWIDSIDQVTIDNDGGLTFRFLNGIEVTV